MIYMFALIHYLTNNILIIKTTISSQLTPTQAHHDPFMLDEAGVQTTTSPGSGPRSERAQQQDKLTMAAIRISIKEGVETNKQIAAVCGDDDPSGWLIRRAIPYIVLILF